MSILAVIPARGGSKRIRHDCGQFYVFWVSEFLKTGNIMKGRILPVVVSELEMQDIDNETDWRLAEIKYQLLRGVSMGKEACE